MCATYRDKERRSNFESFANKIHTGIREIKPDYAEKRAIWELFQNALDTVDEQGVIEIATTDKGFLFKHNGRPFKDDEFGGLIKQFSVGKTYGDNSKKLGQYGTGFISTHVYGKKIYINGSILTDDGTYRTLTDFELDRAASSLEELTDKLLLQDNYIATLCDDFQLSERNSLPYTSFEYSASPKNIEHIHAMLKYTEAILPYIFCFNDKLNKVSLCYGSNLLEYSRVETTENEVTISVNDKQIKIPILKDKENNVVVVLAIENSEISNIPKQFLFYPLMETVNAGYNFIIHANDFKPNRERDYLHKDNGNEELKIDVETNEKLLEIGFQLVVDKINTDNNLSFIEVAKINFNEEDTAFEKRLKSDYINSIRDLERIEIENDKYSFSKLQYFDETILQLDDDSRKYLFLLLKQFRKIPSYEIFCEVSNHINNWNDHIEHKFETLSLQDIGNIIVKETKGNYLYIKNKDAYKKFISIISTDISLLNRLALVPNMHGDFKTFENLVKWDLDEPELIKIIDAINVNVSEKYIHKDFKFLENLNLYDREKFKEDFSKYCNDHIDDISKNRLSFTNSEIKFKMLIQYLTKFVSLNKKTNLNIDVSSFYKRVFELDNDDNLEITEPTVNINYQPAIKLLAHLYFKSIVSKEIGDNISDFKEILSIMSTNTNLREELLHKLECLPNQELQFKSQNELKKDLVKDPDFKNFYDNLIEDKIRKNLVFEGFEKFLQHSGSVDGNQLGEIIETKLNKERKFIPVNYTTIDIILTLIEKISERPNTWGHWLPNINRVKEEILMHKFQNEKTRSSLFSILTKNEKTIELLGDLAKIDNLSDLIRAGKEKQKEEIRKSNHLTYINEVGLIIQNMIENELNLSLKETIKIIESTSDKKLSNIEEQNGQDFIIYKSDNPIYYIEVKSRWDVEGIVALSKRQVERCANNKDNYAVITVNVANYKSKNKIDFETISFADLKDEVKVNLDLGDGFEKLIKENSESEKIAENTKLIEFRGHVPQKRIEVEGISFQDFINNLKKHLINA